MKKKFLSAKMSNFIVVFHILLVTQTLFASASYGNTDLAEDSIKHQLLAIPQKDITLRQKIEIPAAKVFPIDKFKLIKEPRYVEFEYDNETAIVEFPVDKKHYRSGGYLVLHSPSYLKFEHRYFFLKKGHAYKILGIEGDHLDLLYKSEITTPKRLRVNSSNLIVMSKEVYQTELEKLRLQKLENQAAQRKLLTAGQKHIGISDLELIAIKGAPDSIATVGKKSLLKWADLNATVVGGVVTETRTLKPPSEQLIAYQRQLGKQRVEHAKQAAQDRSLELGKRTVQIANEQKREQDIVNSVDSQFALIEARWEEKERQVYRKTGGFNREYKEWVELRNNFLTAYKQELTAQYSGGANLSNYKSVRSRLELDLNKLTDQLTKNKDKTIDIRTENYHR
jgi:hypothetical protein